MRLKKHPVYRQLAIVSILVGSLSTIVGCTHSDSRQAGLSERSASDKADTLTREQMIEQILTASNEHWSLDFGHNDEGRIDAVFETLLSQTDSANIAKQHNVAEITQLLSYLRSYYYFSSELELNEKQKGQLNQVLLNLSNLPEFYKNEESALRLQEGYLVTLYLFYIDKSMHSMVAEHRTNLIKILKQFNVVDIDKMSEQQKFTAWESVRTIAFLAYEARRNEEMKKSLVNDSQLVDALLDFSHSRVKNDWLFEHAIWVTAYLHVISEEKEAEAIDKAVMKLVDNADFLSAKDRKFIFSNRYLVNSYRDTDNCNDEFKGRCVIEPIDVALPVNHQCSDSLFIRASQMSESELKTSCDKLTSQETFFHELLNTQHQPTADDLNTSLRVIIFNNYSQYNRHGQLLFNIGTNNGGMYIEGKPEKKGNQATFYSYEAYWKRPDFSVWNLNHEYVHYLDGRYVKYGAYGHFPDSLVWWSEGMAEYISQKNDNPKALKLLSETESKDWPDLQTIFSTKYSDGQERTYRWSYFSVRYLADFDRKNYQLLAKHLKENDFSSYKSLLSKLATKHQPEFAKWLQVQRSEYKPEKEVKMAKARTLYRYLYRDYLMPEAIQYSEKHRHIDAY